MWNANTEADLAGYTVQYGTTSGNPSTSIDVGNVTSRAFTGLQVGSTYYFRVVAYNTSGAARARPPTRGVLHGADPAADDADDHVVDADERADGRRHGDHDHRHELRDGRDGAHRRGGGDGRDARELDAAAGDVAGRDGGRQSVQVTNSNGQSATAAGQLHLHGAGGRPTLTSVTPSSGPTAGGTTITLTGTGFVIGRDGAGRRRARRRRGLRQLDAASRRDAGGHGGRAAVRSRNPNGASRRRSHGGFTYTAPVTTPTLTSVSPTSGPTTGGTMITLTGTNFVSGATVRVGGTAATDRDVRERDAADGDDAGRNGGRARRAGHQPRRAVGDAHGRLHLHGAGDGADADVGVADVGSDGGRDDDHADRHELRVGRDGARRRHGGDERGVRQRDAAAATTPAGTAGARDVQVTNPDGQSATRTGAFTYTGPSTAPDDHVGLADLGSDGGRHVITLHRHELRAGRERRRARRRRGGDADVVSTQLRATTLTARSTPARHRPAPVTIGLTNGRRR